MKLFRKPRKLSGRETWRPEACPLNRLVLSRNPDHFYAIGDVHGCLEHLLMLEEAIVAKAVEKSGTKLIVLLGDVVDRGPDSAGIIEHLLKPPPKGFYRTCLRGNHEAMMLDALERPDQAEKWLELGGAQTLFSYGFDMEHLCGALGRSTADVMKEFRLQFPASHLQFLQTLPVALSSPSFVLVHAGVRPGVPFDDQSDYDLMWIREPAMVGQDLIEGKTLVHGHTPRAMPLATIDRIAIDTKAYASGSLTAVRLGGATPLFLQVHE